MNNLYREKVNFARGFKGFSTWSGEPIAFKASGVSDGNGIEPMAKKTYSDYVQESRQEEESVRYCCSLGERAISDIKKSQ